MSESFNTKLLYDIASFHFISEDYDKLLKLLDNISSFKADHISLTEIYFMAALAAVRLNDRERFGKYISLLGSETGTDEDVIIVKAEQAFIGNNVSAALHELKAANKEGNKYITELWHLYNHRYQLLTGGIANDAITYEKIIHNSLYSYFICIIEIYRSIGKASPEVIDLCLSQLASGKYNFPDVYVVKAQHCIVANNSSEAEKNIAYAKSLLGDSSYPDFLQLQLHAESFDNFSAVHEELDKLIKQHPNDALSFLNSITIEQKKNAPETAIFKYLLQSRMGIAFDSEVVLKNVISAKSKAADYKQKYFLDCIAGEIYLHQEDKESAASEFYNAGIECYNNNSFTEAEKWLRKAYFNNPAFVKSGWYLADSLYINSYTGVFPYTDPQKLEESLAIIDACFKTVRERNEAFTFSWVYLLKAYVHERIGPTPDKNLNEENRKALAFIEMALLNDAKSLVRVKTAARLFSNLGLDINAFGLSGESAEINKSDFEVQEEYVRSLLNKGDYDLAEILLPRLYELNPTGKELYDGWKAYSLYMRSAENPSLLSEAIELTERKVIKDKDDLWTHFLLLHAYWLTGNTTKALQQADWIAGIENNDNYNSKNTELAFAYFVKGDVKKALAYNSSAKKIPENMPGALLDSTCYLIADNNLEDAKKDFAKLDDAVLKKSEIKNYIRYFVIIAERYSRDNKNAAAIQSLVHDKETGFIALLNKKLQTAKEEADPVNEINSFLDKPGYEEGSWGWFALQLSLFRHFVIRKKYAAALDCFTSVMNDSRSADYILTWNNAADFINAAVVKQQNFADAYSQVNSLDKKIYPADVISIISSRLMDMLHDKLKTKNKITWQLPVTPIALELPNELIPAEVLDNNDTAKWDLFATAIPEMRTWFRTMYGMELPGIRVWPLDQNSSLYAFYTYQIRLKDVQLASGTIYKDYLFCPDATAESMTQAGIDILKIKEPEFKLHGKGVWIHESFREILDEKNLRYWSDPLKHVMQHLQSVLENNMTLFFSMQQLADTLDTWRKNGHEETIDTLFAKDAAIKMVRLGKIIRCLLEEKIPVTNAKAILDYCSTEGLKKDDIQDDLQNIRAIMRSDIIKTTAAHIAADMPAKIEDISACWLHNDNGKIFMQAAPQDVQEWLAGFREFVGDNASVEIVRIKDRQQRRFIKKIMQLEYPKIEVIENFD